MQVLILKICRLYNVFGCGSSHGIYAIFIAQTTKANGGRAIGLLRGAGTRFATWFYEMHRALRLEGALFATVHDPHFAKLDIIKTNNHVMLAVHDVKSKSLWRAVYILLRCVFPALRLLRYSDSKIPAMGKLYYLLHRVTVALETSTEDLNDNDLFLALEDDGGVAFEIEQFFGSDDNKDVVEEDVDDGLVANL